MLTTMLKAVLFLSALGAGLICILFLLKPVTKRVLGSRWQYYAWLIVLIVMVLPISIHLPSKQENADVPQTAVAEATVPQNPVESEPQAPEAVQKSSVYTPVEHRTVEVAKGTTIPILDLLAVVWLAGTVIFLLSCQISYWRFRRTIRKNSRPLICPLLEDCKEMYGIRANIQVRETTCTNTPLMVGVFRPTLLLPDRKIPEHDLYYILVHELTHYQRHDLWYKWFAMLVNSIHWFNPAVYFLVRQINEECEISCDLTATRNMNEQEKKGYMNTILNLVSFGKKTIIPAEQS